MTASFVLVCFMLIGLSRRRPKRRARQKALPSALPLGPSLPVLKPRLPVVENDAGLKISDTIELIDWNRWMKEGSKAIRLSIEEGAKDPEEILGNALRRLYPGYHWPPKSGSPLEADWSKMVAAFGRVLEKPYRTRFQVVS